MARRVSHKAILFPTLLLACLLAFALVSGGQFSEPEAMERARGLAAGLEGRLNALLRELSELGNSEAAASRKRSIPLEMENAVQGYQGGMRLLIADTRDADARRRLQVLLEETVARSRTFTSQVRAQSKESYRSACLDDAYKTYQENWESTCRVNGVFGRCALPPDVARNLEENHRHARDECFRRYP